MFAVKAGLRVGQRSLVTLTTGFSISSEEDQPTVVCAHFCPTDGEWQIRETYQEGDKAFRGEIEEAVDASPHAVYFKQVGYGLIVRMALLKTILNGK